MNEQKTLGFICLIFSLFLVSQNCLAQDQNNPQPKQRQRGIQYVEPTVHQTKDIKFFEGMAVGVVIAGAGSGMANISLASAIAVSLGIAIQNVPEGAIISMPMRAAGNSCWREVF